MTTKQFRHISGVQTPVKAEALAGPVANAFTVDVEDFFHVQAFADRIRRQDWTSFPSRVVPNTRRLLDMLDEHAVRGTFFILGWVADRHPQLVREIHSRGHEIGCHSYWHRLIHRLTPTEFRDDLRRAAAAIANVIGMPVRTFRAPSFSVTRQSLWALEILADEGFTDDSSIFPIRHDVYGIPGHERFPHIIQLPSGPIREFPLSVHQIGRMQIPVAGGGYFRLYPACLTHRWLDAINTIHKQPFVFYIHPWEIDAEQPRLPGRWRSRLRHYQNLHTTERKLHELLKRFPFTRMSDVLDRSLPQSADCSSSCTSRSSCRQTMP